MEVVNNTMTFSKIIYSERQEDLYELVGTIKTDVVPIEYYDFESKKKALKIKKLLDEKASLYKTLFANKIDRIILTDNLDKDYLPNSILISPKSRGSIEEQILAATLGEDNIFLGAIKRHFAGHKITKKLTVALLEGMGKKQMSIGHIQLCDLIVNYVFETNNISYLEQFLKAKDEAERDALYHTFFEQALTYYSYDILNSLFFTAVKNSKVQDAYLLKNCCAIEDFCDVFLDRSGKEKMSQDLCFSTPKMPKEWQEKTLDFVYEILDYIDPTGNLRTEFLSKLYDGTIYIWNIDNEYDRRKAETVFDSLFSSSVSEAFCIGDEFVNCPLNGRISDIPIIIHEFMHLHLNMLYENYQNKCPKVLFDEFLPIFFERVACEFIERKENCPTDLKSYLKSRHVNSVWQLNLNSILVTSLFHEYLQNGNLTYKNQATTNLFTSLGKSANTPSYEDYSKQWAGNICKLLLTGNKVDVLSTLHSIKYPFADALTCCLFESREAQQEKVSLVLDLANSIANPQTTEGEILRSLGINTDILGLEDVNSKDMSLKGTTSKLFVKDISSK